MFWRQVIRCYIPDISRREFLGFYPVPSPSPSSRRSLAHCAATLLRLGGLRHEPPLAVSVPVKFDITQADLAHMTNLSRNSVGAILRVLREKRCGDVEYGQLHITVPEILKTLLDSER